MSHRPSRPFATLLAAALLAVACRDHQSTAPPFEGPLAAVSDGANSGGNADFFFLPPLVGNPSTDMNFEQGDFNPNLRPFVEICLLNQALTGCDGLPFPRQPAVLNAGQQHYQFNWDTGLTDLIPTRVYRIFAVIVGRASPFGFVDVQPVVGGMKNVRTGDTFAFHDGRVIPVKMRFENDALCAVPAGTGPCTSEVIDLAVGGTVIIDDGTGDRIDIPAQQPPDPNNPVITVTLERGCTVGLTPTFGQCLRATAEPPLGRALFPRAIVSLCSVLSDETLPPESDPRHDDVTLFRQDGETIVALPHADDRCGDPQLGSVEQRGVFGFARAGWDLFTRGLEDVFLPRQLHATTVVLDVGPGGETDFFSIFQFVLPPEVTINFETYPDGLPTCSSCPLTDEYRTRGVVFSFDAINPDVTLTNAQLFLSSPVYDPVGGPTNHSVTSAGAVGGGFHSGVVSMTFAGSPGTAEFRARGNNSITVFPIAAFDAAGLQVPAAQITRTDVSTYTPQSAVGPFRQETVRITNTTGISRVEVNMNGFIVLIDNLRIEPTPVR